MAWDFLKQLFGRLYQIFFKTNSEEPSNECAKFFASREDHGGEFWKHLDTTHPECACEACRVSPFSPGPLDDAETVVTVITNKRYVSDIGTIEPTMFDQRISNGISVDRRMHTTLDEYTARAEQLTVGEGKSDCGSIELSVAILREIRHGSARAFAIYDTALENNTAHAEIACTEVPEQGTPARKAVRSNLRRSILNACLHEKKVMQAGDIFK